MKTITLKLRVPDWIDEKIVKYRIKKQVEEEEREWKLFQLAKEILDFDEKTLKEFENTRAKTWTETKSKYVEDGIL